MAGWEPGPLGNRERAQFWVDLSTYKNDTPTVMSPAREQYGASLVLESQETVTRWALQTALREAFDPRFKSMRRAAMERLEQFAKTMVYVEPMRVRGVILLSTHDDCDRHYSEDA